MELYPGAHCIQSLFEERNLFQYLFTGDNVVLVDTGVAATPEGTIFPYMDRLGLAPERLMLAITTHPDLDHQGGNYAIKRRSPGTWLACGETDRLLVESPQTLYDLRYNFLRADHAIGLDVDPGNAGRPQRMDITLSGGETIRLSDGWELEVWHVPGHSHGHLAVYDRKHRAAFVGDAIHGSGCPDARGGMAIPVTYYYVHAYLATLRYLESQDIEVLLTGHWPIMQRQEIHDFIAESRRTVELLDTVILRSLAKAPDGLTMKELVGLVSVAVGNWPQNTSHLVMFPLKGHLDRLVDCGHVRIDASTKPLRWQLC